MLLDTCLVWEMLLLPSDAQAAPSLPSSRGQIGHTSDQPFEYVLLEILFCIIIMFCFGIFLLLITFLLYITEDWRHQGL